MVSESEGQDGWTFIRSLSKATAVVYRLVPVYLVRIELCVADICVAQNNLAYSLWMVLPMLLPYP